MKKVKSIWHTIKENRDWVLIILGAILIIFAALNLINFNPYSIIANMNVTPAVDQAGFAPIFVPKPSAEDAVLMSQTVSPDIPERLVVEKISLDAPVEIAQSVNVSIDGKDVIQFLVPEKFAAGWHEGSAPLGVTGNTVISGHHNAFGEVFKDLVDLEVGDSIILISGKKVFDYIIANKMILPEQDQSLEVRLDNGRWILPSRDERVTLVTCWPERSNTHRLIIVAVPVSPGAQQAAQVYPTPTVNQPLRLTTPAIDLLKPIPPTPQPTLSVRLTTPVAALLTSDIPTPVPADINFVVRNAGRFSVNIRILPSIESKIVGSFKAGNEANGLGRTTDGTWIYIKYEELEGWVDAELVQILTPVESLPTIVAPKTAP